MVSMFASFCLGFGLVILLAWITWAVVKKTAAAATPTGQTAGKAIDTSEQVAAYVALTGVRHVEAVAADAKAVEACDYLRSVVTSWKPVA